VPTRWLCRSTERLLPRASELALALDRADTPRLACSSIEACITCALPASFDRASVWGEDVQALVHGIELQRPRVSRASPPRRSCACPSISLVLAICGVYRFPAPNDMRAAGPPGTDRLLRIVHGCCPCWLGCGHSRFHRAASIPLAALRALCRVLGPASARLLDLGQLDCLTNAPFPPSNCFLVLGPLPVCVNQPFHRVENRASACSPAGCVRRVCGPHCVAAILMLMCVVFGHVAPRARTSHSASTAVGRYGVCDGRNTVSCTVTVGGQWLVRRRVWVVAVWHSNASCKRVGGSPLAVMPERGVPRVGKVGSHRSS